MLGLESKLLATSVGFVKESAGVEEMFGLSAASTAESRTAEASSVLLGVADLLRTKG